MSTPEFDVLCECGHTIEDHAGSDQEPCDECECMEYEPSEEP